jgi:acyl-coenzyme A thioesterase PaaI-like protein
MTTPQKLTLEALEQYAERCNAHPSLRGFGVKIHFPDLTRLRLRVDSVTPVMRGGLGDDTVVNGGVLSALCDALIGCTCGLVDPTSRSATVQLAIRFERPLRGELIQGEARVDRATQRLIFASAELSDERGEVCVRCQGIASLLSARA